jgi:hypothetical protein
VKKAPLLTSRGFSSVEIVSCLALVAGHECVGTGCRRSNLARLFSLPCGNPFRGRTCCRNRPSCRYLSRRICPLCPGSSRHRRCPSRRMRPASSPSRKHRRACWRGLVCRRPVWRNSRTLVRLCLKSCPRNRSLRLELSFVPRTPRSGQAERLGLYISQWTPVGKNQLS